MKKITLIITLMWGLGGFSQSNEDEYYNLFVSGGTHAGFFAFEGHDEVPYQIHIDKLFKKKHVLGFGYSYDTYRNPPFLYSYNVTVRQNYRLRYYKYFKEENCRFAAYLGFSAGCSVWREKGQYEKEPQMIPSVQFLYGFKIKLNETFFSQTEFGLGSPYFAQTSIGMKF